MNTNNENNTMELFIFNKDIKTVLKRSFVPFLASVYISPREERPTILETLA